MRSRRALAVLVTLLVGDSPRRRGAHRRREESVRRGQGRVRARRLRTALAPYQRANMILPAPNLYYNIGATYERLGRYQEAALAFDKYFELAGPPQNDEDKDFQDEAARARRGRSQDSTTLGAADAAARQQPHSRRNSRAPTAAASRTTPQPASAALLHSVRQGSAARGAAARERASRGARARSCSWPSACR